MKQVAGLACMAVALGAAQPAWAESWRLVTDGGEAPDRSVYFVDSDSVVREGDVVRFRTSTIWETSTDDSGTNKSVTQRRGVCSTRSGRIMVNSFYANGVLVAVEDEPTEMTTFAADTLMGGVLDAVCGKVAYQTDAIADYEAATRRYFAENR